MLIFNGASLSLGCSFSELSWSYLDTYPPIFTLDLVSTTTKITIEMWTRLGLKLQVNLKLDICVILSLSVYKQGMSFCLRRFSFMSFKKSFLFALS